jgi:hypothetical protein
MKVSDIAIRSVRIKVMAAGAYAAIEAKRSGGFASCDVLLPAGKVAQAGLIERAEEAEKEAARLRQKAETYRLAAEFLVLRSASSAAQPPEQETSGWRCECGCVNDADADACEQCGTSADGILASKPTL